MAKQKKHRSAPKPQVATVPAAAPQIGPSNEAPLRPLWVSLLAAPVLYMIYFFAGYMLAETACAVNVWQQPLLTVPSWIWIEMGLMLVTSALILLSGRRALAEWRRTRQQAIEESSARFMAFGALFFIPLFVLVTLFTGLALMISQPCSWI